MFGTSMFAARLPPVRWLSVRWLSVRTAGRPVGRPHGGHRLQRGAQGVADEGPGLAASGAEHVFERFYRAGPSRSRAHGGSGLAIAAAVAEGHGGRLEPDTAPGRGCTFRLVLPVAD
ncbi:ATP-binding protein [Streptomyces sp. NPDC094038]|uniref:ATP-binding protein n=1 Tax=Streptomyces sp. NPDC094038 TaxID=3366055 RepID=UPI0037FC4EFC